MLFSNLLCAGAVLLVLLLRWIHKRRNMSSQINLPPGSMGLPLIGETVEFMISTSSFDMHPFIKKRMKRYGSVFKTNLFGQHLIISADPELNYLVFQQEGKNFQRWYPNTFKSLIGLDDDVHLNDAKLKFYKGLIVKVFGTENIKEQLLQDIDNETRTRLHLWSSNESIIELKTSIGKLALDVTSKRLISCDPSVNTADLMRDLEAFITSMFSFPLNIPGTSYHKSLQGRKNVMNVLKRIMTDRMLLPTNENKDFVDICVDELRKEKPLLTEETAANLIFVLLIVSFETISLILTLVIKFITENPKLLEDLTDEHEAILRKRAGLTSGISWEEYKSMTFTHQVIIEAGRLANVLPANFQKTLKNFQINGFIIPKDWIVMVYPPATHLNPEIYEDPLSFNPMRWKDQPELTRSAKNYLVFGGGSRYCVGAEYSKLEMAIFLHYLVTMCSWKAVGGGRVLRSPGLDFPDGYHIQLKPRKLEVL